MTYLQLIEAIEQDKIDHAVWAETAKELTVVMKDQSQYTVFSLGNKEFIKDLQLKGLDDIRIVEQSGSDFLFSMVFQVILFIIMYLVARYMLLVMSAFKTENKNEIVKVKSSVKFDDVAGMSEEKAELQSAISSLVERETFEKKGIRPVRGVLFEGPPGVGKTMLAKAIAGEAKVNFLSYSGSSFSSMFAGVGTMKVRAMYKRALDYAPCVVFIDEIDSVGAKRSSHGDSVSRENNSVLNTLLEVMDGVSTEKGVLFVGATNLASHLDDALMRPGRFDKIIHIGPPMNKSDREAIVEVHLRNKELAEGLTVEQVGKLCYGLTGAQIEGVLNEAVIISVTNGKDGIIDATHIDEAVMKLSLGGIAKGKNTGADLERVAIHEMGHALMNLHVGRKVVKVAVQPYSSGVGGVTITDHETAGSRFIRSKTDLIKDIKTLYGGMVAEEVVLGDKSTGNSNDLERATELIHHMVSSWGMSDDSLLVGKVLSDKGMIMQTENSIARMESLAKELYQEVYDYLSRPDVKEKLIELSNKLAQEEVIFDLEVDLV